MGWSLRQFIWHTLLSSDTITVQFEWMTWAKQAYTLTSTSKTIQCVCWYTVPWIFMDKKLQITCFLLKYRNNLQLHEIVFIAEITWLQEHGKDGKWSQKKVRLIVLLHIMYQIPAMYYRFLLLYMQWQKKHEINKLTSNKANKTEGGPEKWEEPVRWNRIYLFESPHCL